MAESIQEIYSNIVAAAPTPVPTSNISAMSANGVENPVDNGKPASEIPVKAAEPAPESTEAAPASEESPKVTESVTKDEPKPVETPPAKQDSFAKRFALAAQKEKELRQREQELDRRANELKRQAEVKPVVKEDPFAGLDVKKQPLSALNRMGITLQDIQEAVLRGETQPTVDPLEERLKPINTLAEEVKALKAQLQQKDVAEQQTKYEQLVASTKADIAKTAEAGGYDLIKSFGEFGVNTVFETMQLFYNQTEKVLTFSEACDMVEENLEQEWLPKLSASNKLKAKFQPQVSAKEASEQADKGKAKPDKSASTLTNKQSSMPSAKAPDTSKMGRDELINWLAQNVIKHQG